MCYNIAFLERRMQKYDERYKNILPPDRSDRLINDELPLYYFVSGFAHPILPLVKHDEIFYAQWGLIPFWIKDTKSAKEIRTKTLNAVGETIFVKPSFRKSIETKRCLLGVSGFYEWREQNKVKYPYYIFPKNNNIFSLGCIYDSWVDQATGEIIKSFSILTTPANPLMAMIHNTKKRMPLIISPHNEKIWINPNISKQQINNLIEPYKESEMDFYNVSQKINNTKNNRNIPEILEKVNYPELH